MPCREIRLVLLALSVHLLGGNVLLPAASSQTAAGPLVVRASRFAVTPPVSDLVRHASVSSLAGNSSTNDPREIPLGRIPRSAGMMARSSLSTDPVANKIKPTGMMPSPWLNFEGISNLDGVYPSDCNGDVGLSQYVEMVNCHMAVFNKLTGVTIVAPFLMSSLYAAAGFPAPASTARRVVIAGGGRLYLWFRG